MFDIKKVYAYMIPLANGVREIDSTYTSLLQLKFVLVQKLWVITVFRENLIRIERLYDPLAW